MKTLSILGMIVSLLFMFFCLGMFNTGYMAEGRWHVDDSAVSFGVVGISVGLFFLVFSIASTVYVFRTKDKGLSDDDIKWLKEQKKKGL